MAGRGLSPAGNIGRAPQRNPDPGFQGPVCFHCGKGPSEGRLGCLVALAWRTDLGDYERAHFACLEQQRRGRAA